MFGFRVPARGVPALEKAIQESGHSQAEFFRLAVEAAINGGDVAAAGFHSGEQAGLAKAGELIRHMAERMVELGERLERKGDSGVEAFEIDDGGE